MSVLATTTADINRWAVQTRGCNSVGVENFAHARYLLAAHAGHGGECQPYQDALRAVSAVR